MTVITKQTTGEPCNAKVLSTVRWGTMGKEPNNWHLACRLPNYQHGTLLGYEVRAYLLEKWNRQCTYCGAKDVPFQVEHIHPRAKGGTNRVSNLCLACEPCNKKKGAHTITTFLTQQPERLKKILAQAKAPLKDATAVNATRWALFERLNAIGLPMECGSGGVTTFNRTTRGLPKAHWIDASCVGKSTPPIVVITQVTPLRIHATGHGNRHMCLPDRYGFPRASAKGAKQVKGFQTGDLVKAVVTAGKKRGTYRGRVAVRRSGSFNITTQAGTIQGISYRHCQLLQRCDGYRYHVG